MDITIDWKDYEIDFMGEKIIAVIRPLKREAMMLLIPHIMKSKDKTENKDLDTQPKEEETEMEDREFVQLMTDIFETQQLASKILPVHLKEIRGLTVNKEPVTVEMLIDEANLAFLTADILTGLMEISQLTKEDAKNSQPSSDQKGEEMGQLPDLSQASG